MCCFAGCAAMQNLLLRKMCGLRPMGEAHTFREAAHFTK